MTDYRVLLTDRQGVRLGQVPPDGLTYERRLGGLGGASLQVRLDHPAISGVNRSNLDTWATEVLVLRDEVPVWNGPVVSLDANAAGNVVDVSCATATAWLSRRYVTDDLPLFGDPGDLAAALVAYAQDPAYKGPQADCRLVLRAASGSTTVERTYLASERPQVLDAVTQLADSSGGFDLTLDLEGDLRVLRGHHPSAGTDLPATLRLGQGGLMSFVVQQPGEQTTTRVYAVGNGEGSSQVTASTVEGEQAASTPAPAAQALAAGLEARYGVHEQPLSATDIKDPVALQMYADGFLAVRLPPVQVVSASYRVAPGTPYRFADLGDRVRLVADRGWLQVDQRLRVVAEKVTVSPSGTETVDLTFNNPVEG